MKKFALGFVLGLIVCAMPAISSDDPFTKLTTMIDEVLAENQKLKMKLAVCDAARSLKQDDEEVVEAPATDEEADLETRTLDREEERAGEAEEIENEPVSF